MNLIQKFLAMIQVLMGLHLKYQRTGDGSNGTCDCIGLVIGAIRRMGLKWTGIHGSNYAARKATVQLAKISSLDQLAPGHVVYKAYEPGHSKYDLPGRYKKGGAYYNGDLKDYYHVGVITSVKPVVITHMTTPTVKTLTVNTMAELNKYNWGYFGQIKPVYDAGGRVTPDPAPTPTPSAGTRAIVVAASGGTVNLRKTPSTSGKLLTRVKLGETVDIVEPGEVWASVKYGKYSGYMMAQFLDIIGDGKGNY